MYSYQITNQSENIINVVFNNNNNKEQTTDLSTSNDICWQYGTSTTEGGNTIYAANAITCPSTAIINVAEEDILNLYPSIK